MAIGQQLIASVLPLVSLLTVNINSPIPADFFSNTQEVQEISKQEITWVVKEGETLSGIAKAYYGEMEHVSLIIKDNDWIKNPNIIEKGWSLKLREKELSEEDKGESRELSTKTPIYQPVTTKEKREDSERLVNTRITKTTPTPIQAPIEAQPSNYDEVYKEAGARFGVSWEILYGLHLTETGLRNGEIYNKQGSGAQGPMQFMPGTWRAYGVDGNGDGVVDINNTIDAIHGAANYLAKHGSLNSGLRSYGGNTSGVLAAARSRGFSEM